MKRWALYAAIVLLMVSNALQGFLVSRQQNISRALLEDNASLYRLAVLQGAVIERCIAEGDDAKCHEALAQLIATTEGPQ